MHSTMTSLHKQLTSTRNDLIEDYAALGATSKEIQQLLGKKFNTNLSMRQIQRIRKAKGVSRMETESPLDLAISAIKEELKAHGQLLGYRAMQRRLQLKYSLVIRRNTVMMLLGVLDVNGTAQRRKRRLKRRVYRSKGPNFCWHCDGYDKLKPYGIAIHGCIDGDENNYGFFSYSRRVMWLQAASSNNNPKFITYYYIQCVKENQGCPRLLRTDLGTENCNLALIQPMLRHFHADELSGIASHRYGKSTANQRIEAFWCQLRKSYSEWWISFFKALSIDEIITDNHFIIIVNELEFDGLINTSNPCHIDSLRFAFSPLINEELSQFMVEWNSHRIRLSRMAEVPAGVPEILYRYPEINGCEDYKMPIENCLMHHIEDMYSDHPSIVDPVFFSLASSIMRQFNITKPSNYNEALYLYLVLIQELNVIVSF